MLAYTIFSIICIAMMVALLSYLIVKFIRLDRAGRIDFIKSFKKGKCTVVYLIAIPIYFMNLYYSGNDIVPSLLSSIESGLQLVVLKYNIPSALMSVDVFYSIAVYMCFVLVTVNALMITVSILHQSLWRESRIRKVNRAIDNKCYIIGNNSKSKMIYRSANCAKIIIGKLSKAEQDELYVENIAYKSAISDGQLYDWLTAEMLSSLGKTEKGQKINVIINNGDEQVDLAWCGRFIEFIADLKKEDLPLIDVYVFGNREFEDVYSMYESKSRGCLHYINEYQQIAVDFVDRYPLTEFMNGEQIDYEQSLIRSGVDINVAMIGFGRTNQQIFLSMVANNQFLTKDEQGKIVGKKVEYHLFDKLHSEKHKHLNHNYCRYKFAFLEQTSKIDKSEYLPLPSAPSTEKYHYLDVNDGLFYEELRQSISFCKTALNYVIVSLGMDYASIDMANKIVAKIKEWGLDNTKVFVRIREKKIFKDAAIFLDLNLCHPFGTDDETVYDFSHIIQEKFSEMAIMRNFIYDIERDMNHAVVSEAERQKSRIKWFENKTAIDRESNIYCCLSLRNKLHLIGLDYCRKEELLGEGLSAEEYLDIYAKGDKPDVVCNSDGEGVAIRYPIDFKPSRRKTMAIQEHERWNAFMILKGFIPATKEEICNNINKEGKHTNGKSYSMRHHGCLTTFDGLIEYRKILVERDKKTDEDCDVIKYDYQLLDGAWWLLNQNGYKIIKRQR